MDNKLFLPNCLFYSNLFFILNKQTIKNLNFIVKRPFQITNSNIKGHFGGNFFTKCLYNEMTLYYFELKHGIIVVCYEKDTHTIVYLFNYSFTLMSQFLPEEPIYCADKINETSIMLSYPKSIAILLAQSDKLIVKYTLPLWNFASNFIVMHDEIIYSNNQSVEALNVETKKITLLWKNEGDTDDPLSCIDFSYGVIPQMNLYSIGYTERIDFFDWNSHQIVKSFSNPINKDISTEMSCPFVMKNKFFFLFIREKIQLPTM